MKEVEKVRSLGQKAQLIGVYLLKGLIVTARTVTNVFYIACGSSGYQQRTAMTEHPIKYQPCHSAFLKIGTVLGDKYYLTNPTAHSN